MSDELEVLPSGENEPTPEPEAGKDIELTGEQESKMIERWNQDPSNPPSIKELGLAVFGREVDGRRPDGRAIKKCLAKHNLKARMVSGPNYTPKPAIELSEAHKDYIRNQAKNMNPLEMAKVIFANPNLTNLNQETRAVTEYVKTLDSRVIYSPEDVKDVPVGEYRPPKTLAQVLEKVNQYVSFVTKVEKLSPQQKKNMETLIGYLHTYRLIFQMNSYDKETERKSCEDAFIRYTYDKPDLTQEELDQYIVLANEVVMGFKIQARSERLQQALDEVTESTGEDRMKISMSLVEAIGKAQGDYNACIKRQGDLLDDLKEKRSTRMSKAVKDNASVLNLIGLWKQEETRKQLLDIAKKEQKKIADEVEKLSSVADVKARILGLTKDEAMYG